MKSYKTLETLRLFGGVIGMTPSQAELRKQLIKQTGRGTYEIVKPVEFKAGEIVRLAGVPKSLTMILEEVSSGTED